MNIRDFKLWFQGFADSVPANTGLSGAQFAVLKAMVEKLGVADTPSGDSGSPKQDSLPADEPKAKKNVLDDYIRIAEELEKWEREEKERATRRPPFGGPSVDPFDKYRYPYPSWEPGLPGLPATPAPNDYGLPYPQIWCVADVARH